MNNVTTRMPQARHVVIVNDSVTRWVALRTDVAKWLNAHDLRATYNRRLNLDNCVVMSSAQYDAFCRNTPYFSELSFEQIQTLEDRGAEELHIA